MRYRIRLAAALVAVLSALAFAKLGLADQSAQSAQAAAKQDANITRLTTNLLEHSQFSHHPFDEALAGKLLERYLDALDSTRSLFLKSDLNDFAAYRPTLAHATRDAGDTTVAHVVFDRYKKRLRQQVAYVTRTLKTASFDFTGNDVYQFDRSKAQWPHDLAAAQALWRTQLRSEYLQEKLAGKKPADIVKTLTHRHNQQLKTLEALRSNDVLEIYLNALAHVYDPHSDYLGHEQLESFSIAMNLSLFGIGASLQSEDGYCKIHELIPGGPAAKSGLLKPGDRIIAVAQGNKPPVDIVNMPLSQAVELIRGPKGSVVKLTLLPAGAGDAAVPKTATLVRDEIKLEDQAAKASILDLHEGNGPALRLGVIDLPSFYADDSGHDGKKARSATADVAQLLRKLKAEHVRGIVLDLRQDGGGSLAEAISMTGLFIRTGPVVQTRDQSGHIEVSDDSDPSIAYDGPLVVLTSRFSASASEILAGALQDYGRAVVVGDSSTFGKGTVQTMLPLAHIMDRAGLDYVSDPGALKLTTNKFYRPSGASTQLRGVASDIVLPSTSDFSEVAESALKNPLPWDVVPPKPYKRLGRVKPYLTTLREKSAQRVAAAKSFEFLKDEIARIKERIASKTVSLNEAERRQEVASDKARHEAQASVLTTLQKSGPTTYEITLAKASAPGLPAPGPFASVDHDAADHTDPSDDLTDASEAQEAANAAILNEGVHILADYVQLLNQPKRATPKPGQRTAAGKPATHERAGKPARQPARPSAQAH